MWLRRPDRNCGVCIRFDDPTLVPELLACLGRDAVWQRLGENELDVMLVNSMRSEEAELELERRLDVWRHAHPNARVRVHRPGGESP